MLVFCSENSMNDRWDISKHSVGHLVSIAVTVILPTPTKNLINFAVSIFCYGFAFLTLNFRSHCWIFHFQLSPQPFEALHPLMALSTTFMPPSSPKLNLYSKIRRPFYPHSVRFLNPLKIRASTTLDYSNVSTNDKSPPLKVRVTSPSNF